LKTSGTTGHLPSPRLFINHLRCCIGCAGFLSWGKRAEKVKLETLPRSERISLNTSLTIALSGEAPRTGLIRLSRGMITLDFFTNHIIGKS
jgi:hypothetical protein